jgi:spermidine synthase
VIPWEDVDREVVPGYGELSLHRRGAYFVIRLDGAELMGSHDHRSEDLLAEVGCSWPDARDQPRVLIGGLGLGYTLRAVLDRVPAAATVEVSELVGATIRWNRGPLADLAKRPLDDPRTVVVHRDVAAVIADGAGAYDAIMLDVDNGPDTTRDWGNPSLYSTRGLERIVRALRPGGVVAIWAASETAGFTAPMHRAGLEASCVRARAAGAANRHVIWVGRAPGSGARGEAGRGPQARSSSKRSSGPVKPRSR